MWIKFIRDIGTAKTGSFADVDEAIARNYVNLGVAEAAPEDPAQRAAAIVLAQVQPLIQAQADRTRTELRTQQPPLTRPRTLVGNGNDGVAFTHLTPGQSEAEKRRAPSFYIRSVVDALGNPDVESRTRSHEALVRPWDEGGFGCARTMAEGSGATGGYTTPVMMEAQIFEVAAEEQVILPYADERPLAARQVEWPAINQYAAPAAGQSAMYGGIKVYRKGENTQRTESEAGYKKVQMVAQDLTAYTELSRDLVQDSPGVDSYVVRAIGGAIGWREDWESINGNGAGQFLGYLNAPCTLFIARNTGNKILYQDVFTMKTRLMAQAKNPCWICHPYAVYQIETLQDPSGKFIYIPNATIVNGMGTMAGGGITYKPVGMLLGWPLYTSEKVPPLGSTGDLSLLDRKTYWVGRRSGLEIGLSEHFRFDTDELAIRAKVRNDGKPGLLAPLYLADGTQSNQVSGFVALQ